MIQAVEISNLKKFIWYSYSNLIGINRIRSILEIFIFRIENDHVP